MKKPGTPKVAIQAADISLNAVRACSPGTNGFAVRSEETSSQNARRRSTRRSGGLPTMSAALIAPIEIPATQSIAV